MLRLARLSIARPRLSVALWAVVAIALSLAGLRISDSLSPSKAAPAGTEAAHAAQLVQREFGPTQLVPVLLEGPAAQLDRQGPALAQKLAGQSDIHVMTPWDGGPLARQLRPRPDAAMIIADVAKTDRQMFDGRQEQVEHLVRTSVTPPVTSYVTGTPALQRGLADASLHATRVAVALSLPILFVLLLVVLRAPVAALVLAVFGTVTATTGIGVMALFGKASDLSPLAVPFGSLTGLATGVGYALLVYRRWADDHARGVPLRTATVRAVDTSGRAVLVGGTVLAMAMILAAVLGVRDVLTSEGAGAVICGLLGIGAAVVVLPAVLMVLGPRLHWLRFPAPRWVIGAWERLVLEEQLVVRRAVWTGAGAVVVLGLLGIPAGKIDFGPPNPLQLPASNEDRVAYEQVAQVMGPGWVSPYNMVIVSTTGPITDPKLIGQVAHLQSKIAADKRVVVVAGPGSLAATSQQLSVLPKKLQQSQKLLKTSPKSLGQLESGLSQASTGTATLRSGLQQAASGAGQIHSGSGSAQSGAALLHAGLAKAHAGSVVITAGLNQALSGANQLTTGAAQALAGSSKISGGLGQALTPVQKGVPIVQSMAAGIASSNDAVTSAQAGNNATLGSLDRALSQLQGVSGGSAASASVQQAQRSATGVSGNLSSASQNLGSATAVSAAFAQQVAQLSTGLSQLFTGSTALHSGLAQLQAGNARLAAGIGQLASGGSTLTTGIAALQNGAASLHTGLGQLTTGSGTLATKLSAGVAPVTTLENGLVTMHQGVVTFRHKLPSPKDLEKLQKQSPGLFTNGYFVLAAVQGAPPAARNQAQFAVNLQQGGNAGQILVVPTTGPFDASNTALGNDLRTTGASFAATTKTEVALGGQGAELGDFVTVGSDKVWTVIGGIAVASLLLLVLMLRSVLVPLVAVACSLLTSTAGFGVLQLLYGGSSPVIGTHGTFTPETIMGFFAIMFGFATVLQVVLLERAREDYLATADPQASLRAALRQTASGATLAAVAMVAVALPFLLGGFLAVEQFAVASLASIALAALVVRPVLLPAVVHLLGRAAWWPTHLEPPGATAPTIPLIARVRPAK